MSSNLAKTLTLVDEITANAEQLGTARKLILVADKLTGTLGARQCLIKLFSATPGARQWINGVVVDDETLYQEKTDEGELLVDVLKEGRVLVGIPVKMGSVELPDSLAERCQKYYNAGARFVELDIELEVDPSEQSQLVIDGYANRLARCAKILQENGLVPIVGCQILVNGSDDIYKVTGVSERVLVASYKAFNDHHVLLKGTLLKPNVVTHGFEGLKVAPQVIADDTLRVLNCTVPAAVSAIIFSHGALGEEEPTFLDAVSRHNTRKPWPISSVVTLNPNMLMDFAGEEEKMEIVQAEFIQCCKAKAKAYVVMPEGVGAIVMSEGFDTVMMPGGVANFEMPGGGAAVTGATVVMPEWVDTFGMPRGGANLEMSGGGANLEMPGGGANFGMPGGGGPVPGASQNLRPTEYIYEFKFGFNAHFFFSASAH